MSTLGFGFCLLMLATTCSAQKYGSVQRQLLQRITDYQWQEIETKIEGITSADNAESQYFYKTGVDRVVSMSAYDQHRRIQYAKSPALDILVLGQAMCLKAVEVKKMLGIDGATLYRLSQEKPTYLQQRAMRTYKYCPYNTIPCSYREQISKYQSANGHCNNLKNPLWGRSFTPFTRLEPPAYADGVNEPRLYSVTGTNEPLPSSRKISSEFHSKRDGKRNVDDSITHMVMQFGQFIDHDHSSTPIMQGIDENGDNIGINCCKEDIPDEAQDGEEAQKGDMDISTILEQRKACYPIEVPPGDKVFHKKCINFVRSIPTPHLSCQIGPREQVNQLTAYIDGSQIYGSTKEEQYQLRAKYHGLLKYNEVPGFDQEFLPDQDPLDGGCLLPKKKTVAYCTLAGDKRVNEHSSLTSMHTIWLREHNRLARQLKADHPWWDDNLLFHKARRIVIAQLQHILYNEFLPVVIGYPLMEKWDLVPRRKGYFYGYNPHTNAQIAGAFSTAAFRFGHSLIPDRFPRKSFEEVHGYGYGYTPHTKITHTPTVGMFNSPGHIFVNGGPDSLIWGLTSEAGEKVDRFMSTAVLDKLFQDNQGNSLDLIALNIQRGRDHGIPAYNVFRKYCKLPVGRDFNLMPDIPIENSLSLGKIYSHIDDIDLFVGGLAEEPVKGGIVGPTFACIIAEQHHRLKAGDRYFYENKKQGWPTYTRGFTQRQLDKIRKSSLAGIICSNTNVDEIQRNVFRPPGHRNWVLPCHKIHVLNTDIYMYH